MSSLRAYLAGFRACSASLERGGEPQFNSAGGATTQVRGRESSEDSEAWVTGWEDAADSVWSAREFSGPGSREFGSARPVIAPLPGKTNWSSALIAPGFGGNALHHVTNPRLR
jgi:hypothetical protein